MPATKKPKKKAKPEPPARLIRCVTFPIRAIVATDGTESAKVLETFNPHDKPGPWRLATDLANWCQRELALTDLRRAPADAKIGKYEAKMFGGVGLYTHVTANCPFRSAFDGAAGSMSQVVKHVEDAWRGHPRFGRFAVLWRGEAAPCVFRHPYPWPMRSQELRLGIGNIVDGSIVPKGNGKPLARLTLPGGPVFVRLADGPDFRRQLAALRTLLADPTRIKGSKVTGRRKAGKLVGADLRIVGSFDAPTRKEGGVAVVRTDPNALLVAEVEGRPAWVLNADHVRHLQARHRIFRQRLAEDMKHEKRVPKRQRDGMLESLGKRCDKHASRIDTALHQLSAQVAGYLDRCGVATVAYDDANKEYIPEGFPWAKLAERIRYKLEGAGVEVVCAGSSSTEGD